MNKKVNLWIHTITAFCYGVIFLRDPTYANRVAQFGHEIGVACIALAIATALFLLFGQKQLTRWIYYIHSGFLLGIAALGFVQQLSGESNVMWLFALQLFLFIILGIMRGDVIE
ncbi:hypothetical protein [Enterococcus sp. DIV0800]|uniref:hypothetical protein n=1 Tax=unclassified Enterococcus TaxID=2608891 RepID=UPI003D3001B9